MSMHTYRDQIFGIVNPCSHNTQKLSRNGSEVILKWFNVRVNGESVLRTVPIKKWLKNGSRNMVLSLDPFLDHYLLLCVNATQSWNRSSGLDWAWWTSFWCYLLQNGVDCNVQIAMVISSTARKKFPVSFQWKTVQKKERQISCLPFNSGFPRNSCSTSSLRVEMWGNDYSIMEMV